MKIALVYNRLEKDKDPIGVINVFGMKNKERYNPKTVEKVARALENGGHIVKVIEGDMNVVDELKDFMPKVISGERHGMVFNMAYGIQGQSRYTHIPGMLEMLGIPYVGSGPAAHALALDKVIAKFLFQSHNIPTPEFWVFSSIEEIPDDLPYPLITKPKMEAVSYGIKIVNNKEELIEGILFISQEFQQQVLVEKFISGREFAIGILGNRDPEILPIVEFNFKGNNMGIQTATEKLSDPVEKICPALIDEELTKKMKKMALDAFRALNLQDFSRVDLRMDENGDIYILEINSMASLGATGSYVFSAKSAGYTFDALVQRMVETSAYRYFGEGFQLIDDDQQKIDVKKNVSTVAKIRSYLRSQTSTFEDNLAKIVDINSSVYSTDELNLLAQWISKQFKDLGFNKHIYPLIEAGNAYYFNNHSEEINDILFLGNLDYIYNYEDFIPFRQEKNRIFGSGVSHNKGGIITLLGALKALRFLRKIRETKIGLLLVSDYTLGSKYSKDLIIEHSNKSVKVVGLSGGGKEGGIIMSSSGITRYNIDFLSTTNDMERVIKDLIPFVNSKVNLLLKIPTQIENTDITFYSIDIQQHPGKRIKFAKLVFDVNFLELEKITQIHDYIKKTVEKGKKSNLRIYITRQFRRPPFNHTEKTQNFLEEVLKLSKKIELRSQGFNKQGSSNIGFVPSNISALDGLGPIGGNYPSSEEYIIRDSLLDRAALLALIINNCSTKGKT